MSENIPSRESDIVLSIRHVSIQYRVVRPVAFTRLFKKKGESGKKKKGKSFQAVKDVSFDMHRGEIVGMIGKNGSGKSTLLRALAGIYSADKGTIDTYGHTVGLMAIGVGFVKELSGRDNIYLSGMLMGMTKEQVSRMVDEVISFSELGNFIDEPVESYSSGMYSKLAFAISSVLETDIMLVDETLSVGDQRFKRKSEAKMRALINDENKTVLIVSHSLQTLQELCQRVIWLDGGVVRMDGPTKEVLDAYVASIDKDIV